MPMSSDDHLLSDGSVARLHLAHAIKNHWTSGKNNYASRTVRMSLANVPERPINDDKRPPPSARPPAPPAPREHSSH
ncbi:hypothetical protein EVAR_53626_1 [Eumeta japonica]|uniref:Uncharacterized protein n=1 Tax=Eumeta variegata TaxID=151549 RepID=A0A4C1X0S7_EUMVA|nr:hypothetical protein EVAR_53626_1 [Eumeta japonica]